MKELVARDQVRLGAARCFQLARSGMSYRLFRSGVTVAILALAVAFLAHMLVYGIVEYETQSRAHAEIQKTRALGRAITRLSTPDQRPSILAVFAQKDAARLGEYRRWSEAPPERFDRAILAAQAIARFDRYTLALAPAPRAALLGDFTAEGLLESLAEPGKFEHFGNQLTNFGLAMPLGNRSDFERLVRSERSLFDEVVAEIQRGQRRAIALVAARFPNRRPVDLAAGPEPGLLAALEAAGYDVSSLQLSELSSFARRANDTATLQGLVLASETRAEISRVTDLPIGEVGLESVFGYVGSNGKRAAWFSALLARTGQSKISESRILELSRRQARDAELGAAALDEAGAAPAGFLGVSPRNRWLIALSFLVCAVGVANAMLMSVTERFTEIATMKCLGAMDGFVMLMFVFEALIQGVIGGLLGLALGCVLALLRGVFEYGALLSSASGALSSVLLALGLSLVSGVILAVGSAVGPSFLAARLAPMEAMRVD